MALTFDANDNADIATAIAAGDRVWYHDCLTCLKQKIKESFTSLEVSQCCYCARLFTGEFNMVIDIEHILPQDKFPTERFTILNLNIACKRCNMEIKKADTSFLVDITAMGTNYYHSHQYKIIHPNLDNYTDNIVLKTIRRGDLIFVKYVFKNQEKGKYTYDYFKLKEFEVDTINEAQGTKITSTVSSNISERIRRTFLSLVTRI